MKQQKTVQGSAGDQMVVQLYKVFTLFALLIIQTNTYAQISTQLMSAHSDSTTKTRREIKGKVMDEKNTALKGAIVKLICDNVILDSTVSDTNGVYGVTFVASFDTLKKLDLIVDYRDFARNYTTGIYTGSTIVYNVYMDRFSVPLVPRPRYCQGCMPPPHVNDLYPMNTKISGEDLKHMGGN